MANSKSKEYGPNWLIFVSIIIVGVFFLADAAGIYALTRWTARLGVGLVWSAIALIIAGGRWSGNVAVVITWIGIVTVFLF